MSYLNSGDQKPISITEKDIRDYWFKNEVQGYDLVHSLSKEITFLPTDHHGRVLYNPDWDGFAGYTPIDNSIQVGTKGVEAGDGVLSAFLRHERCHATFSNMSEEDQRKIIDGFWENNHNLLEKYYPVIRRVYSGGRYQDYFTEQRAVGLRRNTFNQNWGYKYNRFELIWDGDSLEKVSLAILIDELIAFSQTAKSGREFLPSGDGWLDTIDEASRIVSLLDQKTQSILELNGFFEMESQNLLKQLKEDPNYKVRKGI